MQHDKVYLSSLSHVMGSGVTTHNRTDTPARQLFGLKSVYKMDGAPMVLLQSKYVHYPAVIHELLWFLRGDTNIKYLVDNNVNIWNEWAYQIYVDMLHSDDYPLSQKEFINSIKHDDGFAGDWGGLGPIYGKQWRDFNGKDQIEGVINSIKTHPQSRRHIVSAWNPNDVDDMALPPCHTLFQFHVRGEYLDCQLYQRSADMFLGVPFNIASYSLLTYLIARECGLKSGDFHHAIGNAHVYTNHFEAVDDQLRRYNNYSKATPFEKPKVTVREGVSIEDITYDDFDVEYEHMGSIKAPVSV